MKFIQILSAGMLVVAVVMVGCQREPAKSGTDAKATGHADHAKSGDQKESKDAVEIEGAEAIKEARNKLSPEDRKLVDAQEYCPVTEGKHLGVMGQPFKIMVKDQPVFLCCRGCRTKALANPEKTLAKVEELKAKVKAEDVLK